MLESITDIDSGFEICGISVKRIKVNGNYHDVTLEQFKVPLKKGGRFSEHVVEGLNNSSRQVICTRKKTLMISNDRGLTWKNWDIPNITSIMNTFTTYSGKVILCCKPIAGNDKFLNIIFDKGNVVHSTEGGYSIWHGSYSIDESDGTIMYAEYHENRNSFEGETSSVFRSKDDGLTWENIFSVDFPGIRHFHTCIALGNSIWIISSGDAPEQSRFWRSEDDGDSWIEITQENPNISRVAPEKQQLLHRTTAMLQNEGRIMWCTDDMLGNFSNYNRQEGEFSSGSRFVSAQSTDDLRLKVHCTIGLPVRSMIDVGPGYIVITEAKYLNHIKKPSVFLIMKDDLESCHLITELPNLRNEKTGGTYSFASKFVDNEGYFFTRIENDIFSGGNYYALGWRFTINQVTNDSPLNDIRKCIEFTTPVKVNAAIEVKVNQDSVNQKMTIHGNIIPQESILDNNKFDLLWKPNYCPTCKQEFLPQNKRTTVNCEGNDSCRPRYRSIPIMVNTIHDILSETNNGKLLAFAYTSFEERYLAPYFSETQSASLYGEFDTAIENHLKGIDVRDLSKFANNEFSGVFSCLLFDYFLGHEQALNEVAKVLKPGGLFITHLSNHRLLDDYVGESLHAVVKPTDSYMAYYSDNEIHDIRVGKKWFHDAMDRAGLEPCTLDIIEPGGELVTWFIGRKRDE